LDSNVQPNIQKFFEQTVPLFSEVVKKVRSIATRVRKNGEKKKKKKGNASKLLVACFGARRARVKTRGRSARNQKSRQKAVLFLFVFFFKKKKKKKKKKSLLLFALFGLSSWRV
jgi:hypothetical protein